MKECKDTGISVPELWLLLSQNNHQTAHKLAAQVGNQVEKLKKQYQIGTTRPFKNVLARQWVALGR